MARGVPEEAFRNRGKPRGDWQRITAFYYGMVSLIDKQVGRIMTTLAERGFADNTIIVFTADHGLVFKGTTYDQVTRTRLIVTPPPRETGATLRRSSTTS